MASTPGSCWKPEWILPKWRFKCSKLPNSLAATVSVSVRAAIFTLGLAVGWRHLHIWLWWSVYAYGYVGLDMFHVCERAWILMNWIDGNCDKPAAVAEPGQHKKQSKKKSGKHPKDKTFLPDLNKCCTLIRQHTFYHPSSVLAFVACLAAAGGGRRS